MDTESIETRPAVVGNILTGPLLTNTQFEGQHHRVGHYGYGSENTGDGVVNSYTCSIHLLNCHIKVLFF